MLLFTSARESFTVIIYNAYLCRRAPDWPRFRSFSVIFGRDHERAIRPRLRHSLLRFRRRDWFPRSPLSFGLPALSFSAARSRLPFLTLYVMYVWYL